MNGNLVCLLGLKLEERVSIFGVTARISMVSSLAMCVCVYCKIILHCAIESINGNCLLG